ncbi:cell division protein FtsA, partial [Candidatus Uhrbacteria bacterium CG_4_9_14_3_um_filter_36_7]
MSQEIITGLDIGSYAVRVATGQILPGNQDRIQIIGAIEVPSSGVRKGVVTDLEETISSISKALEQAERLTGFPIERVWVGISGSHILTQQSKGVIGVARNDGEIREEDVSRALEAA